MGKPDLNLDAYRLVADLLHRLRQVLRYHLRESAGDHWEERIPDDLRLFLSQRRMREQGVSWFRSADLDLLDYASFSDLAEIFAANPALLEGVDWLPPSGREAVLKVRFLELDTILQRVAYARPVSELEIELLAGLGERIRRSFDSSPRAPARTPREARTPAPTPSPPPVTAPPPAPAPKSAPNPTPDSPADSPSPPPEDSAVSREAIAAALRRGDTKVVMSALYREVVTTADVIFKTGQPPACPVWEEVRESSWYQENFRRLSLAPLSHFFDIVEDCKELARQGTREEILEALRNRGFAQTLLLLKELFQPHLAPAS